MMRIIKIVMIILVIFGMGPHINGVSFAQDDDGGGGDAGDIGDAGDVGGAGDAGGIDDGDSDTADYQEEAVVETQYEETAISAPGTTSATTIVTHGYTPGGYVYNGGRSAIVDAAVVGVAAGAAAGSAATTTVKSSTVVEKTTKRPLVVKKRPPAKTMVETAQAKDKERKE